MGKVAASTPFFKGAMPEGLQMGSFPFSTSHTICFTASDKDLSAALRMTIQKKLQRDRSAERWHALLPSALSPKGEARRYVANDFLNLIALPEGGEGASLLAISFTP